MNKLNIKKDDQIVVISGKDKGKKGKVLSAYPDQNRILVSGINLVTKHKRPKNQRDPGGIIHQEAPINASNAMLVCNKCDKATRAAKKTLDNGKRVRVCKKCGDTFDK